MRFLGLGDNVIDYYSNMGLLYPGGNAVNTAAHAAILGEDAAYLGNLGDDKMAGVIRGALAWAGVDDSHCPVIPGGSTKYCEYTVTGGEREFVKVELGRCWPGPLEIGRNELDYMAGFDVIHSCCNAKMEEELWKVGRLNSLFTYDFSEKEKYRTPDYLQKVCPHLDLALFSCPPMNEAEARAFCRPYHELGPGLVVVTMGADGQYVSNGRELLYGAVRPVRAVDTMGAGDAFITAFIVSLVKQGWKKRRQMSMKAVEKALEDGAAYAALNCLKEGGFGYNAGVLPLG